jgi:hypothetical protein
MYREDREIAAEGRRRAEALAKEDRDIAAEQKTYERGQTLKDRERAFELDLRKQGLDEDAIKEELRRWNLEHGLEKERVATDRMTAVAAIRAESDKLRLEAEKLLGGATRRDGGAIDTEAARMIMSHVNALLETYDEGTWYETGWVAGFAGERNYADAAKLQQRFTSQKLALYEFMKSLAGLGRLSDKDVELINDALPNKFSGESRLQGAYEGIGSVLERETKGQYEMGPSPFEEGYIKETRFAQYSEEELTEMTDEEMDSLSAEEFDDLQAEMKKRKLDQ